MSNIIIELVPLGALAAIAYVIVQYLHHRQRMKLIEKSMATVELPALNTNEIGWTRFGVLAIALGLAIFISQIFEELFSGWGEEDTFAMGSIFIGVALIIHSLLSRKARASGAEKQGDSALPRTAE